MIIGTTYHCHRTVVALTHKFLRETEGRVRVCTEENSEMAMRQFYNEIRGMKVKDLPSHLKLMCSQDYVKKSIQRGLDNYHAKYIQTSSVDPLFHVCFGGMVFSYLVALPEERRHLEHQQHAKEHGDLLNQFIREKIKPVKELLRAKKKILNCKLGIRDAIQQLDSLSSVGRIEESVMAPDGSVYHEHIFCAKCMQGEASLDNDIILCDGACNRAFHQKCLEAPLHSENIPPEDQGWFCRICDLKMEILESVNAHLGTCFSLESNWQEIFKAEAALSDGGIEGLHKDDQWPSDDSEDDDYSAGTSYSSHSTSTSTSLSWSLDKEFLLGSPKSDQDVTGYPYSSDELTDADIILGRRQRSAVDYKKLYNEMFGKDGSNAEQFSEDED
ncbi:hypothetical protein SAY87_022959 [Trapa incisa]|uniref:PHD-type domain-containing protein n=1 Tax=Trapa incisa TaxID=236973 RepID=A0AAN7Q5K6_9MYRT|nr:hypothetical protein SAY87_022959 [Trapa incisa]